MFIMLLVSPHHQSYMGQPEEDTTDCVTGIYGQCLDFPYIPMPRRKPLENSTLLVNVTHASDIGDSNGTNLLASAVSD